MKRINTNYTKKIPFFQVDAFSDRPFSGNPAAVCLLDDWLDDESLQFIAAENNLSETAFVVKKEGLFSLRWFTPTVEVDLCGHATLAAASVLLSRETFTDNQIHFSTRSGFLSVSQKGDIYSLDFPAVTPEKIEMPDGLSSALGLSCDVIGVWQASDIVVMIDNEQQLDVLMPDFTALLRFNTRGIVVCSPSKKFDFRSRWFGPQVGVNEDPVTGSAHTFLAPLWAGILGKNKLYAQQGGKRQGEINCLVGNNGRVELSGKARLIVEGFFYY